MEDSFHLHRERRALFSSDVASYEDGRPGYPEPVFELLRERCGLGPATKVLEIGPGTGQATGPLLDAGASVTAVEIGPELASRLRQKYAGRPLQVEVGAFEESTFEAGSFDMVAAATSFHWVPTEFGLRHAATMLRPGGWLALWWNCFGDPDRPDPFHDALDPLLQRLAPGLLDTPSAGAAGTGAHRYGLASVDRMAEIDATGAFGPVHCETIAWTGRHTATQLRAMFASFSPWLALPVEHRTVVLDALEQLAVETFDGVVERPYLTPVYLAERSTVGPW